MKTIFFLLSFFFFGHLLAQSLEITITDQQGTPLSGATIFNADQSWFVLSGEQGEAIIPFSDTIFIQYLGFELYQSSWQTLKMNGEQVMLHSSGVALPEIVVKKEQRRRDLSQQKLSLSAIEIQSGQLSTPVDALADAGGAFIQKSQHGGGSPIIRGFEANRVLLMVDGVRLNNAIYRSGHLQNGITIDESALASVDLTYGPGALAHGSDALGGVLHFKTKEYLPATQEGMHTGWIGQAFTRFATGKQEATAHLGLAWQGKRWSTYTAITASRFGDSIAGDKRKTAFPDFGKRLEYIERIDGQDSIVQNATPNLQYGSGYDQIDILQKVIWQAHSNWLVKLNVQLSTSSDVPRYDALTEYRDGQLRWAEWYYGPQKRLMGALSISSDKKRWYTDWVKIIISRQQIDEDRHQRKRNKLWLESNLVDVTANNLTIDAQKHIGQLHSLQYGMDARLDKVSAKSFSKNVDTKERLNDVNTRYPSGGSSLSAYGVYFQYRYHSLDSSLLAESGIRLSNQSLNATFSSSDPLEWPIDYLDGVGGQSNAFTWATGLRWKPSKWAFRAHIASGFRAPNVDDFAKFREKTGFIQIPNPSLKPEQSISSDLSLDRSFGDKGYFNITAYRTWLRDIIIRENFQLPDGNSILISRGDTLLVQANQNSGRARIWGISVSGQWKPITHLKIKTQLNYTKGERLLKTDNGQSIFVPLDHIPPLFGSFNVSYHIQKWEIGIKTQFQGAKKLADYAVTSIKEEADVFIFERLGSSDNLENSPIDPKTGDYTGSYAWWAMQLQTSVEISSKLKLRLNVNNVFDVHYRSFSSGISAPGRMVVAGLYAWF